MWLLGHNERLECPEFNEQLTDTFGVNDFGDPLYRVIWGMCPIRRVSKPEGGYDDMSSNIPSWLLQRWVSPAKWGSPQLFRIINPDPANGQLLFPYPEFGEYETVYNLGDRLLDYDIIHMLVPLLDAISKLTDAQVKAWNERQKELENKRDVEYITDRLMDSMPTRYGPVSYSRGGCRSSVLDRKMHEIQSVWNRIDPSKLPPRGMSQR